MSAQADHIHFIKDLEVRDLDTLDLASVGHALHQGVHLANLPFRIALFGPWGSGKTTVMRRVQVLLDADTEHGRVPTFGPVDPEATRPENDADAPFVKTLYYNPWEYESDASLLTSLVRSIASMVPDGVRYSRKGARVLSLATELVQQLDRRPGAPVTYANGHANGAVRDLGEPDRLASLRSAFRRLVDLTLSGARRGQSRRLVIFIDDLDKCVPERVLAFLEGCKLFFSDRARVVFVFALDRQVLSSAVEHKYSRGRDFDPERYIEKIFEFSYTVHPIQWHQLGTLVSDLYERAELRELLSGDEAEEQLATIEEVLRRPGVVSNPRRIKRTFNKFIWFLAARDWLPQAREIALERWLSWLLVTEYWRDFRSFVGRYGAEALGEVCNRVTGNLLFPHANESLRQAIDQLSSYRPLLDYFRVVFTSLGDMHAAETQAELRELIESFITIDKILRTHGL